MFLEFTFCDSCIKHYVARKVGSCSVGVATLVPECYSDFEVIAKDCLLHLEVHVNICLWLVCGILDTLLFNTIHHSSLKSQPLLI